MKQFGSICILINQTAQFVIITDYLSIMFVINLIVAYILKCLSEVQAFPQGATIDACHNLLPRHYGTYPDQYSMPFNFTASSDVYGYSKSEPLINRYHSRQFLDNVDSILVKVDGAPFKGFLIIAVDSEDGKRIGRWHPLKDTINLETCAGITHANNNLKKSANLLWLPPANKKGSVTFVATILQNYDHYYTPVIAKVAKNLHF